jgi:hypothetical protein
VGRHGPSMSVHRQRADVAHHHEQGHSDEQPRR